MTFAIMTLRRALEEAERQQAHHKQTGHEESSESLDSYVEDHKKAIERLSKPEPEHSC